MAYLKRLDTGEKMKIKRHIEKALVWGEIADFYDSKHTGRKARTLPMDAVFNWAKTQPEIEFDEEQGVLFWRNKDA